MHVHYSCRFLMFSYTKKKRRPFFLPRASRRQATFRDEILQIAQPHSLASTSGHAILGSRNTAMLPDDLHPNELSRVQFALLLDRLPIAKGDHGIRVIALSRSGRSISHI